MNTKSINFVHGLVTHLSGQHLEMHPDAQAAMRIPFVTHKKETSMMSKVTDTLTKTKAQGCVPVFH